jgi:hypothetical protein
MCTVDSSFDDMILCQSRLFPTATFVLAGGPLHTPKKQIMTSRQKISTQTTEGLPLGSGTTRGGEAEGAFAFEREQKAPSMLERKDFHHQVLRDSKTNV